MNPAAAPPTQWFRVPDPGEESPPDQARFIKWGAVAVGFELEGTWRGTRPNRFAEHGVLVTADGELVRFGLPKILAQRLTAVEPGRQIKIVFLGSKPLKGGTGSYHTFDVYSDAPAAAAHDDADAQAEVPF